MLDHIFLKDNLYIVYFLVLSYNNIFLVKKGAMTPFTLNKQIKESSQMVY